MRLVTYDRGGARRLGAWVDGALVDLPDAVGHPSFPTTMEALVAHNGGTTLDAARDALGHQEYVEEFAVRTPRLLAPLLPPSFRGQRDILGPDEELSWPPLAESVDYQMEVACIIGRLGRDLANDRASSVIFGYTLLNDWSTPWNPPERPAGEASGSRRGFAVSLGPCVVTPDEFEPSAGKLRARIDGELWSEGDLASARGTFSDLIAQESRGRDLYPGDVYGSGTFPGGSSLDLGRTLPAGAVVELEADGIGILRNRLGKPGRR